MTGWTLWRRWWKVQQSTPSRIFHVLFPHTCSACLYPSLSLAVFYLPHKLAYRPANALSRSLVSDGQLLMSSFTGSACVCVYGLKRGWNWSSSVKMQSDLWHLKAENAWGWNDDGPRWEERILPWVWFCLAFIAPEKIWDGKEMVQLMCVWRRALK